MAPQAALQAFDAGVIVTLLHAVHFLPFGPSGTSPRTESLLAVRLIWVLASRLHAYIACVSCSIDTAAHRTVHGTFPNHPSIDCMVRAGMVIPRSRVVCLTLCGILLARVVARSQSVSCSKG